MKSDENISLRVLQAIEDNENVSQRLIASELGIAVGLTNSYVKRLIKKGFVKIQNASPNRYLYYLTPRGFAEKSRLTSEFLSQSLSLFRLARSEGANLLLDAKSRGLRRIGLVGKSELCEITILNASEHGADLVAIVDPVAASTTSSFMKIPVYADLESCVPVDAFMITALRNPQAVYDDLIHIVPNDRILTMKFLDVRRQEEVVRVGGAS